jgi:hypothetical protein
VGHLNPAQPYEPSQDDLPNGSSLNPGELPTQLLLLSRFHSKQPDGKFLHSALLIDNRIASVIVCIPFISVLCAIGQYFEHRQFTRRWRRHPSSDGFSSAARCPVPASAHQPFRLLSCPRTTIYIYFMSPSRIPSMHLLETIISRREKSISRLPPSLSINL